MAETINLDHVVIVLNRPRFPENIGSAARAMRNMGIEKLVVVAPENFDIERIHKLATHAAKDVIDRMECFETLSSALASCSYVVGTTARTGNRRQTLSTPSRLATNLIPISIENRIAIVFGPEDRGLINEELRLCHTLVTIPTAEFSSINLAQSVMLICYELFNASRPTGSKFLPRLATRFELDPMYEQLKNLLVRISYIQPDNPDHWMGRIRKFFSRLPLRSAEVTVIRGICRQVDWYAKKCYMDGRHGRPADPALKIPSSTDTQPAE